MTEQECWTNLTLASLRLAWPDRADRHLDEPGAYFTTQDDDGDVRVHPLDSGNVAEWIVGLLRDEQ